MHSTVAVVGAGIGGLAAAGFLRRAGVDVRVYEQAAEFRAVGAGIIMQPNAMRLIRRLGCARHLAEFGVRLESAWELRRWQNADVLFSQHIGQECVRRYGEATVVVHRADLLDALRAAVPADVVRLNSTLIGVDQQSGVPRLEFADGHVASADIVIGADGMHSVLRPLVAPQDVRPTFTGMSAFRALIPAQHAPEYARRPVQTAWLGPGRHVVHYPVSGGEQVNLVAVTPTDTWTTESWTAEGSVEDLFAEFADWSPVVQDLIGAVERTSRWALFVRDPLREWTRDRIALLGDAAHPMLPFLAQGAAQALEDAAALATCVEQSPDDLPAALRRYEVSRLPRASYVQRMSLGRTEINHLPDGPEQRARDAAFAEDDPLAFNSWLYLHDAQHDLLDARPAVGTTR